MIYFDHLPPLAAPVYNGLTTTTAKIFNHRNKIGECCWSNVTDITPQTLVRGEDLSLSENEMDHILVCAGFLPIHIIKMSYSLLKRTALNIVLSVKLAECLRTNKKNNILISYTDDSFSAIAADDEGFFEFETNVLMPGWMEMGFNMYQSGHIDRRFDCLGSLLNDL